MAIGEDKRSVILPTITRSDLFLEAAAEDVRSTNTFVIEHQAGWWASAIDHLAREATQPGPGNRAVLARLSELLFMEVIRWQLNFFAHGRRG